MQNTKIARALLQIDAVGFSPQQPVTFSSGIVSPVYVDNRRLIYWPEQWHAVIEGFEAYIRQHALTYDVIAGIATGGIPHSSALAYNLRVASVFVRKQAKGHGAQKMVEGGDVTGKRVLLVEDMVTTGGSSLTGVSALREAGAVVSDCLAITTYGFTVAQQAFEAAGVRLHPLVAFPVIVQEGFNSGMFSQQEHATIMDWLDDPHGWAERQNERN